MSTNRKYAGRRGGVLAGCLIALGVLVLLLVIGGVVVAMNWRSWAATGMDSAFTAIIDKAELAPADADAMKGEVASLMQDFRDEKVSFADLGKVLESVAESPVLAAASIMVVDKSYIGASELTAEEKAEGSTQLSRFVRGLFAGDISKTKIDDATEPLAYDPAAGGQPPRARNAPHRHHPLKHPDDVTTEELQAFLANCKEAADGAGIPPERYEVDMAAEFSAAIDRALGRAPALPESDAPTPPTDEPGATDEGDAGGEG